MIRNPCLENGCVREIPKVLVLGVRRLDWVELIVDGGEEEESVMKRIEKLLCRK